MLKTAWVSGLIQTALHADFFYYYFKRYISISDQLLLKLGSCQHNLLAFTLLEEPREAEAACLH
ncbi:hypothetical protein Patl1_24440 [Pistacia atlantica]|uniref:Uncharacterized protein n=1 Tax=Pistacia atlantica TaxID=434234 RepID=A0ACC0ZXP7_9ROSI|nr:hypothetical protein Patl1_24440 [Pistacia atlantica]